MTLLKRNSPSSLRLSDFFDEDLFNFKSAHDDWMPAVNIVDNSKNYQIEVAAPGIKKNDFNVVIENGILTVSGKTEVVEEESKKNYTRKEFSSQSFTRSFTLPENVNQDDVEAKYQDGVLKLTLTKIKESAPSKKEINVK